MNEEQPLGFKIKERRTDDEAETVQGATTPDAPAQETTAAIEAPPTTDPAIGVTCWACPHLGDHHDAKGCTTGRDTTEPCRCGVNRKHIGVEPLVAYARRGNVTAMIFAWKCPNCGTPANLAGFHRPQQVEELANGKPLRGSCAKCDVLVDVMEAKVGASLPGVPGAAGMNRRQRRAMLAMRRGQ